MACVMMVKGMDSGTGPTPREMCGLGLRCFISLCLCVLAWKTRADDKPCTLGLLWGSGSSQTFDPQGVQAPRPVGHHHRGFCGSYKLALTNSIAND